MQCAWLVLYKYLAVPQIVAEYPRFRGSEAVEQRLSQFDAVWGPVL